MMIDQFSNARIMEYFHIQSGQTSRGNRLVSPEGRVRATLEEFS